MTTKLPEANMLLITAPWRASKSFKLIPVEDSVYIEGIYDVDHKVLVMISKVKKDTFHMTAKLDDNGDKMKVGSKPRLQRLDERGQMVPGLPYREERQKLETFQEYYITEKAEIESFIKMIAVNADSFNWKEYTDKSNLIIEPEKKTLISI